MRNRSSVRQIGVLATAAVLLVAAACSSDSSTNTTTPPTTTAGTASATTAADGGGSIDVRDVPVPGLDGHRLVVVIARGGAPDAYPRDPATRRRRPW